MLKRLCTKGWPEGGEEKVPEVLCASMTEDKENDHIFYVHTKGGGDRRGVRKNTVQFTQGWELLPNLVRSTQGKNLEG